ncbi:MAG: efflux RND transporter periplasmic adaptor subunit [Dongiaceae bacterium]
MNKKYSFLPLLGLLILAVFAIGIYDGISTLPAQAQGGPGPPGDFSIKVEAVQAVRETITQEMDVTGTLLSNESAVISAEIAGRVVAIDFTEGSKVKKGDVLFKLDDSVQRAALAQARADLALSQNNVERYNKLAGTGAVARVNIEEAIARLNLARANVALAEANLAKTIIKAPFDGIAGIRQVSIGDVVSAGEKLVNMEQMSPIRVLFSVPERYLPQIKEGVSVILTSQAWPGEVFPAKISAIDPKIDPNSRALSLQAQSANESGKLYPGQFVTVVLPLDVHANALTIPDQALIPLGKQNFVFRVVDGKVQRIEVQVGLRANFKAEILAGLNEGDMVVTAGQQKLQDGMPVTVAEPTPITITQPPEEAPNRR